MNGNINSNKYNLESSAFKERVEFYQRTLNIDLRDYFSGCDNELSFEKGKFYKEVLYRILEKYVKANNSVLSVDFNLDEYMCGVSEDDVEKIPTIVFDRGKVREIYGAQGKEIEIWIESLREFSDKIMESSGTENVDVIAGIMASSGIISIGGLVCKDFIYTYGGHGAMAPVLLEGEFSLAEEVACIMETLAAHPVVLAVIAAAIVIGTVLVIVACLERKLIALIVNDTLYDISVEDVYMEHGEMISFPDDETNKNVIPGKKRENEVYASFFIIEKVFGFYGTECTLRLRNLFNNDSFYLMTANPLSETSRINMTMKNDICTIGGHQYSSAELHEELYSSGSISFKWPGELFEVTGNLNSEHGENAYAIVYFKENRNAYIDFTKPTPEYYGLLECVGAQNFEYCSEQKCYAIKPGGYCCFTSGENMEKIYIAELMTDDPNNENTFFKFGGELRFELKNTEGFLKYTLPYQREAYTDDMDEYGIMQISNKSEKATVYIKSVAITYMQAPLLKTSDWMKKIDDATPLEDINIPGTHDSAAINNYTHTFYACHYTSITEQLTNGIRLLDIRIKVKSKAGEIVFVTCHGPYGIYGTNEFQSLKSVFDECREFLKKHSTETIIISLKIDDFAIDKSRMEEAYTCLEKFLKQYPIREYSKRLGTLGDSRGKIVLFNRINTDERLGYPISWEENTKGSYAYNSDKRDFKVYVQDYWKILSPFTAVADKWKCIEETMKKKKAGDSVVVWNFASACILFVMGLYAEPQILNFFGTEKSKRLSNLGWILMDYENRAYPTDVYGMLDVPSVIIASNFGYSGCSKEYKVELIDEL